jgi:hypothetical protein
MICPIKVTYLRFSVPENITKSFYNFRLPTSQNRLSPEDGLSVLVLLNTLLACRKPGFGQVSHLQGFCLSLRKLSSGILPFLVRSSGIRPISASHLSELLGWKECGG